eukprot:1266283-Rhodomonas_salina.1
MVALRQTTSGKAHGTTRQLSEHVSILRSCAVHKESGESSTGSTPSAAAFHPLLKKIDEETVTLTREANEELFSTAAGLSLCVLMAIPVALTAVLFALALLTFWVTAADFVAKSQGQYKQDSTTDQGCVPQARLVGVRGISGPCGRRPGADMAYGGRGWSSDVL